MCPKLGPDLILANICVIHINSTEVRGAGLDLDVSLNKLNLSIITVFPGSTKEEISVNSYVFV